MGCCIEGLSLNFVIVTGASAGVGLAATYQFIEQGYRVINLSRRPCPNADVISISADLSHPTFFDEVGNELTSHLEK